MTTREQTRQRRKRRAERGDPCARSRAPTEIVSGRFRSLSDADCAQIDEAVRQILSEIGLSDASKAAVSSVCAAGGGLTAAGRLTFPPDLIERALADLRRPIVLCGQVPSHDLELWGGQGFVGTGGAAPNLIDLETGQSRPSTLRDLRDAARLADALENIQFFSRSLVAGDLPDEQALDLNTAFASLAGTTKHVMVSASKAAHVRPIAEIAYAIAGGEAAFRARPCLSMNINHAVPPLRMHGESCDVLIACVRAGIPVHCNVFGQLGASSPVTLAGSVAQTLAEALAGMILAWSVDRDAKAICGPRPMITDLRTGAMSGGSGEQALATAMAAQMAVWYGLANSTIAGATDSKRPDAQAGVEKALSIALALHSGAHLVTQAAGSQAGLMAVSFEACVIDNDMLGAILRSGVVLEITAETLALDTIRKVVAGEGHFLGQPETYARMETDFLYPSLFDRRSFAEWEAQGSPELVARARQKAQGILGRHLPDHVPVELRSALINRFGLIGQGASNDS
ncbi:MAG: trimethylamine methyltransferase family protein [Pseudomonadota bacterium]